MFSCSRQQKVIGLCYLNNLCAECLHFQLALFIFVVDIFFLFCVLSRNALRKQRELITLLRNPQEDPERGPLSVVMETDAGSLPGKFLPFLFLQ